MSESIRSVLHGYIMSEFLPDEDPEDLENDTELVTSGIISSMGQLDLVSFIEETYSIQLEPEDITPERMDTIDLLIGMIKERGGAEQSQ